MGSTSFFLDLNTVLFSKGPLTHTTLEGVTTVYGILSGYGGTGLCFGQTAYTNVAFPAVLNWIRKTMSKKAFFDNKLF